MSDRQGAVMKVDTSVNAECIELEPQAFKHFPCKILLDGIKCSWTAQIHVL
jgi:hypothetical protein